MVQSDRFMMKISPQEKNMLRVLAKHFDRSMSDVLRLFVRSVYSTIQESEQREHETERADVAEGS